MSAARWTTSALSMLALLNVGSLHAQTPDGAGIPVGEANAYPEIRIDYTSSDNVFVQPEDAVEGTSLLVSPRVELIADRRQLTVRGIYAGEFAQGSETVLDHADHLLRLDLAAELDKRRRPSAFVSYRRAHEQVGFNLTRGRAFGLDEPVVFDQISVGAKFRYGVIDARGNVEGGLQYEALRYANLEALSDGRDFSVVRPYGLFSYRMSGDSRAIVELRYEAFSRDNGQDDRGELSLFGGAEFAATGRFSGEVRVGATRAAYDDEARQDVTLLVASADIAYLLREYATLSLTVGRELDDFAFQAGADDNQVQAIADRIRLGWSHEWSSRVSHEAFVERSSITQPCPDGGSSTIEGGLDLNVEVRRWLSVGATAVAESRDGEACIDGDQENSLDYGRRELGAYVRVTL